MAKNTKKLNTQRNLILDCIEELGRGATLSSIANMSGLTKGRVVDLIKSINNNGSQVKFTFEGDSTMILTINESAEDRT